MADQIRVSFSGVSDLREALERMKVNVDEATKRATSQGGELIVNLAKGNFVGSHPPGFPHVGGQSPNVVTGSLKRSIRTQPIQSLGRAKYSVTMGPTMIYSRIIELGGTITPKEGAMLSWVTPLGRRFARSVTIRPHPYFTPAYTMAKSRMSDVFRNAWAKALGS